MTPILSTVEGSEPYPWPYDGSVPFARLALVACGWDRAWSGRATGAGAAAEQVGRLAETVVALGGHVVAMVHPDQHGDTPDRLPLDGAEVVTTAGIDGFCGSPLDAVLRRRQVTHLLVVGHGLEAAVHSTMRSANDRGYECLLVVDACSVLAPELVDRSVSMIHMSGGIFGATATTAQVLSSVGDHADPTPASSTIRRFR